MEVCVAVSLFAAGCAARQNTGLSGYLIKPGEPTLSIDAPSLSLKAPTHQTDSDAQRGEVQPSSQSRTPVARTIEAIDPRLAEALMLVAVAPTAENHRRVAAEYRRLQILDRAYDHLTLAVRKEPKEALAYEARAQVWREWGLASLGLGDAYRAVYLAPTSASAHNSLGTLLQAIGDYRAARKAYRKAIDLDPPQAAYALNNLCYLSFLEGDQADAAAECRAALQLAPDFDVARNNLALSYAASGDFSRAREEFSRVGDAATGAFNLGVAYMLAGEYGFARNAFMAASVARPSFRTARTRARQAAELAGQSEENHGQSQLR